jgi:hypothetical protein
MIELGYMAKHIILRPEWLDVPKVRDIYAVSNCNSHDFSDYINYWKHNGFWFFDSPMLIREIATENDIDLSDTSLLYYRGHAQQFDADRDAWTNYPADADIADIAASVVPPSNESLLGYDIVTYSMQNSHECSPLSCNHMATDVRVNEHCLIESLDYAIDRLQNGIFNDSEPGPYRIIAVNAVKWPPVG